MTKLSDIQYLLLSTAAARIDGSLLPPPETLGDLNGRIRKSISVLRARDLAEERLAMETTCIWREEGDQRFGMFITDAGRQAIGVEGEAAPTVAKPMVAAETKPGTKIDTVLGLLRREGGATLAELVGATGWLPHTTRAALTRLRQKGHVLDKAKRDGATAYTIQAAA